MARQVLYIQRKASKKCYLLEEGLIFEVHCVYLKISPSPVWAMLGGGIFLGGYGKFDHCK